MDVILMLMDDGFFRQVPKLSSQLRQLRILVLSTQFTPGSTAYRNHVYARKWRGIRLVCWSFPGIMNDVN